MLNIGDKFVLTDTAIVDNYGEEFRNRVFTVSNVITNSSEHIGYDDSMKGMALYSAVENDFHNSVYEYEIEELESIKYKCDSKSCCKSYNDRGCLTASVIDSAMLLCDECKANEEHFLIPSVEFWHERDFASVTVFVGDKIIFECFDEKVYEMVESGLFKFEDEKSVIAYCKEVGLLKEQGEC